MATATAFRLSSARAGLLSSLVAALLLAFGARSAHAAQDVYYQCPGNVFTNTITAKEADARGCKSKEAQQPTTIPAPKARAGSTGGAGPAASRVDAQEQKSRDTDARKILQDELIKAQAQLDALQKEYNAGQPDRQGNEKNYQKYLDRTADLKASVARAQSDVDAITRELAKNP